MIESLKKYSDAVDALQKIGAALVWAAELLGGAAFGGSRVVSWSLVAGCVIGGLAGYHFTLAWWSGNGKERSIRRGIVNLLLAAIGVILIALLLSLTDSEITISFPYLANLHNLLVGFYRMT